MGVVLIGAGLAPARSFFCCHGRLLGVIPSASGADSARSNDSRELGLQVAGADLRLFLLDRPAFWKGASFRHCPVSSPGNLTPVAAHQPAHSPASESDLAGTEPCTLVNPFSGWRHTVSWASASVCAFRSLSDTSSSEVIGPVFPDCHLHPRPAQVASCRQNRIPRCPQFPALSL